MLFLLKITALLLLLLAVASVTTWFAGKIFADSTSTRTGKFLISLRTARRSVSQAAFGFLALFVILLVVRFVGGSGE